MERELRKKHFLGMVDVPLESYQQSKASGASFHSGSNDSDTPGRLSLFEKRLYLIPK
jgi:hypothetical protein